MDEKQRRSLKKVVALKYDPPEDSAPKVTAKGQGIVAEKIIEVAKKNNIPIRNDPELVNILSQLDLDEEIPPTVYQVVAEVLAFVYSLKGRWKERGL